MTGMENGSSNRSEQNKAELSVERQALWLIDQAKVIRAAEDKMEAAMTELRDKKLELGRFIGRHSLPEVWSLLPDDVADEIVSCMPSEGGYFGLEPEEGSELHAAWLERTGVDPNDLIARR